MCLMQHLQEGGQKYTEAQRELCIDCLNAISENAVPLAESCEHAAEIVCPQIQNCPCGDCGNQATATLECIANECEACPGFSCGGDGLSGGAVAAIVIIVLLLVFGGIGGGVYYYMRKTGRVGGFGEFCSCTRGGFCSCTRASPPAQKKDAWSLSSPTGSAPNTVERHPQDPIPPTHDVTGGGDNISDLTGTRSGKVVKTVVVHPDGSKTVTITEEEA